MADSPDETVNGARRARAPQAAAGLTPVPRQRARGDSSGTDAAAGLAQTQAVLAQSTWSLMAHPEAWPTLALPPIVGSEEARRFPWVAYWSVLCAASVAPALARAQLETASEAFAGCGERWGELLCCAAVIETFHDDEESLEPLDAWITRLQSLLAREDRPWPGVEVEIQVMACGISIILRDQAHPLLAAWVQRGELLMRKVPRGLHRLRLANFLVQYFIWHGNFAKAGAIIDAVRSSVADSGLKPIEAIHCYQSAATHARFVADHAPGLDAVAAGLALCDAEGCHNQAYALHAKGAALALSALDAERAAQHLEGMRAFIEEGTPGDQTHYWYALTGLALLRGQTKTALEYARTTLTNSLEIGGAYRTAVHRVSLAQVLFCAGQIEAAATELSAALAIGEQIGAGLLRFSCHALLAACCYEADAQADGDRALEHALDIGAHEQYWSTSAWWLPQVMAQLAARALRCGLQRDYVSALIKRRGLRCPDPALRVWPWPAHVFGCGRFALQLDGAPLRFEGKAQNKPLDLVKLLLANGGRSLPVARVIDALWPDSEGDSARKSFDAALLRLRRLTGAIEIVQLDGGNLGLAPGQVWSDVVALHIVAGRIEAAGSGTAPAELDDLARELLALYRAPFLEHDEAPWVIEARERLRARFIGSVDRLGRLLEAVGAGADTISLYERATDADPIAESLYRRLMQLHLSLGQPAEALRSYRRCRDMLSIMLGLAPSAETERLAREIGQS